MTITSGKEFGEVIMAGMPAEVTDLPRGQSAAWFPTTSTAPTVFRAGQDVPFDVHSFVVGIFHNDDVIRVYSVPKQPPQPQPENWIVRAPTRYVLSRTAPTYVSEVMSLDVMAAEIIDEWHQVAAEMSSAEAEREAIIDWLGQFGSEPMSPTEIIQDLRDEAHLEDDEDEEEEPETTGVEAVTGPIEPPAPPVAPPAVS